MGCASSSGGNVVPDAMYRSHKSAQVVKSNSISIKLDAGVSSDTTDFEAQQSDHGIIKSKFREFVTMDNLSDLERKKHAALMIQRVARGIEARGSMCKRRNSVMADAKFAESLDRLISPAENASKALMDLATVFFD